MKMTFALLVPLLLLSVPATPALAGDATAGAQKSAVCGACHGATGSSINPEWPNLAGQQESYIVAQLQSFKQAIRDNPLMMPNAALLSDQDMQDLGAHFASQTPAGLEADPSNLQGGRKALSRRRHRAQTAGLHRLSWPAGKGQRAGKVSGTSSTAFGLHVQPAQGLR